MFRQAQSKVVRTPLILLKNVLKCSKFDDLFILMLCYSRNHEKKLNLNVLSNDFWLS